MLAAGESVPVRVEAVFANHAESAIVRDQSTVDATASDSGYVTSHVKHKNVRMAPETSEKCSAHNSIATAKRSGLQNISAVSFCFLF